MCQFSSISNILLQLFPVCCFLKHLKCQRSFCFFLSGYQLYNNLTKQLFFFLPAIHVKKVHFFVDKVYNFVYNSFLWRFSFYIVDNFSTDFSTVMSITFQPGLSNRVLLCMLYIPFSCKIRHFLQDWNGQVHFTKNSDNLKLHKKDRRPYGPAALSLFLFRFDSIYTC